VLPPFKNEPLTNFNLPANREAMEAAIEKVRGELGCRYPIIIDGERYHDGETFDSTNPARKDEIVGTFVKGTKDMALKAVEVAAERFEEWRKVDPDERARFLLRAAALMRKRKFEFAAWQVFEVSKNWFEADADVAEAIDFLEFYAREMMRIGGAQPVEAYPGEENNLYYIPLGVAAVIPPWNFPSAIMVGMTTAALVAGNTVVLKPASAAPTIAWKFFEVMEELQLPKGVLNFLPGPGRAIGDTIVDHPKTRIIAFTGSKEIGLRIHERASKTNPGQIWIKRTVLEMGGKDFILADETAEPDDVAAGIVTAAFGFQGQKCSACSRAIIHEAIYDEVVKRVVASASEIKVGAPDHMISGMGAVIDRAAFEKIMSYIEIGKQEGKLLIGGKPAGEGGWFIEPTVFGDIAWNARLGQEEIFGPVLALIKCSSFEEGVQFANSTEFGLTGSLYSQNRQRLEIGRRDLMAGNLYLNRKCTGALVGVQPFGGFNMSGTDSKAGGRDYLLLFTQGKAVSEKL